nr:MULTISPECIES: CoA transferase [unclassified Rhodococcus (in: high G+C Gram-positive bacteria)]
MRVLDLTDGLGEASARILADLGADVLRVERPGGSESRLAPPLHDGVGVGYLLDNAGKRGVTADLDSPDGKRRLEDMIAAVDVVIESLDVGVLEGWGTSPEQIVATHPSLVWVSVTPFGRTGPYKNWRATEAELYALSGVLSRSGAPGREPVLPPSALAGHAVAVHAAWAGLLAYYGRLRSGAGQFVDVSALEVMVQGFDPGFGVQGSAAAGRTEDYPRGRPDAANFYPVFECADGYVRICLLAQRQWRAMFEWLGRPEAFADPKYDTIPARFAAADMLHPLIASLFARSSRDELVAEGAARGIPVGGVSGPGEVLRTPHFLESGALADIEITQDRTVLGPSGYVSINGTRMGLRSAAVMDRGNGLVGSPSSAVDAVTAYPRRAPLEGIRVLDLGVIVFGAELSRQFADFGADVIKVENSKFPDGLRQSKRGAAVAASVVWGHRNKRSIGLDIRNPQGLEVFRRLVVGADVVLANFKPGTLRSMGISYDELKQINPRIVVHESSAFGSVGPWSTRMGYGPLVRASCGVSSRWRYPDDPELLCDGSTVYPDHIAAQVGAIAVLATLIQRMYSHVGGHIELAQSDTALMQLGTELVSESLRLQSHPPSGTPQLLRGVYACAGDDEWIVVTAADRKDCNLLSAAVGRSDLASDDPTAPADYLDSRSLEIAVREWLSVRTPDEAMRSLQEAGVASGVMRRLPELLSDPQLTDRAAFTSIDHRLLPNPLPAAARVVAYAGYDDPELRQAPLPGEHTREICLSLLSMTECEYEELVLSEALQPANRTAGEPARQSN